MVAAAGDGVGLAGDAQLLGLVVELLGQDEDVLAEVLSLLAKLPLHNVAVRLRHPSLPLSFAPVKQRNADAHTHHVVAEQVAVGIA